MLLCQLQHSIKLNNHDPGKQLKLINHNMADANS